MLLSTVYPLVLYWVFGALCRVLFLWLPSVAGSIDYFVNIFVVYLGNYIQWSKRSIIFSTFLPFIFNTSRAVTPSQVSLMLNISIIRVHYCSSALQHFSSYSVFAWRFMVLHYFAFFTSFLPAISDCISELRFSVFTWNCLTTAVGFRFILYFTGFHCFFGHFIFRFSFINSLFFLLVVSYITRYSCW